MEKRKLWIVTELFYPEETSTSYILTKIANKLVEKYEVNVVCGPATYDADKKEKSSGSFLSLNEEIKLLRLWGISLNKNNLPARILKLVMLSLRMAFYLFGKVKHGDKVFIVTNPAPLLIFVSWIKRLKKFHLVILVHDVFPENTIPARIFKSSETDLYKLLRKMFNSAYTKADLLLVIGRDMKEIMVRKLIGYKRQPKVEVIENWAETDLIYPLRREKSDLEKYKLLDKIVIQYAGNIGRVQGLVELLEIINEVRNPTLHFCFWGNGALKEEMVEYVNKHKMTDVSFYGNYSRESQNDVLNCCDMAIVTLSDGMYGLAVPSKAYNIMAAGKPILFIGDGDSEIGRMVRENNLGHCFVPSDRDGIKRFFNELSFDKIEILNGMGKRSYGLAISSFSEKNILDRFLSFV
ncbi:glycosyltransferase family 4 protein [uncultured Bacteroides sp.]|uniref:glycosyltransferase family 4 protein n=1 Tax=uncultured Bacteroides sp. TaxID=162156 RepID=UPI002AABDFA5|nr:glycosyltransferase family 4 protein [uncultured Bacteroides sp.]